MSEVYSESFEPEVPEPAAGTGAAPPAYSAEAAVAAWDAAADADAAAQSGDDPWAYSEDPAAEYDGDIDAFLAAVDALADPGSIPDTAADGVDPDGIPAEYGGDLDAFLAAGDALADPGSADDTAMDGVDPNGIPAEYGGDLDAFLAAGDRLADPGGSLDGAQLGGSDDPEAFSGDPDAEYDGDVAALLAEEDQLPTRQEARAALSGDNAEAAEHDGSAQAVAPETTPESKDPIRPDGALEPPASHNEAEDGELAPGEYQVAVHDTDGTDIPLTVEVLPPEARTVGETTPTGIGRKPTGGEFLDMEPDDPFEGRFDRFLTESVKEGPDVRDLFGNAAETVHDLRLPGSGPSGGHVHEGHPVDVAAPPASPAFSEIIGSVALVSVTLLMGIRYAIRKIGKGR